MSDKFGIGINQINKVQPTPQVGKPEINKGIESFFGPINNFFKEEKEQAFITDISGEISKFSNMTNNYKEALAENKGNNLNLMS